MSEPVVSILIPAYRAGSFIAETLQSIRAQTHAGWEILVCEDGIFDDTAAQINAFAATTANLVRLFQNQTNQGVSHARNRLLDEARGTYIAFLDADDTWAPEHLAHALQLLDQERADWMIGGYNLLNSTGHLTHAGILPPPIPPEKIPTALLQHNFILTGSIVARSVVLENLRFDPTLKIGEDLDLWIRFVKAGFKPAFSSQATFNYRKHPTSTTGNTITFPEEFSRVFEKYLGDPAVDQTLCRRSLENMLLNVVRMTWRQQPARARAALARLFRFNRSSLRAWTYRFLVFFRSLFSL